jgi:hypothetical protein
MIKFENGKYCGYVNGRVVVRSTSKYYVERKVGEMSQMEDETPVPEESEFTINQRFDFLEQMVTMVCSGTMPSVVITGEGGLGKTYTVMKALEKAGHRNVTDLADFGVGEKVDKSKLFRVIKGFSTAKGLYRTLFDCNGMTIVFDDTDAVLENDIAKNLLKGALDSYSRRYISWMADMKDDDLPKSFEFTGRVVFITNKTLASVDQAIRTRAMCVDVTMTEVQKVERMEVIASSPEFLPEIQDETKRIALAFLKDNCKRIPNLSLRSLIQVTKFAARGGDWMPLAKYAVMNG